MYYDATQITKSARQTNRTVTEYIARLLQKRKLDAGAHDDFVSARLMLETIPLSTDQFGLACTRLKNAEHYLLHTEPGAARYELRLLAAGLKNGQLVREPCRRLRSQS